MIRRVSRSPATDASTPAPTGTRRAACRATVGHPSGFRLAELPRGVLRHAMRGTTRTGTRATQGFLVAVSFNTLCIHNLQVRLMCIATLPVIVAVFAAQSPALVATRAAASAHEMAGCTAERIDGHFSAQSFYMYDAPELNHRWLRHCARFRELRHSSKAENSAEVGLHKVLARHPRRTRNPAEARLFYVPIFEYSSKFVGAACANASTTPAHLANHTARMSAAYGALLASPHWRAHGGRDHVWAWAASTSLAPETYNASSEAG